jgi:hypothetical protein
MLMVEINVEVVPVIEAEVDAVQQMRELDSYPGHPTPFNQVCDGVQNFDSDVDRRQGELKAANSKRRVDRWLALTSTKRRHASERVWVKKIDV